MTHLLWQRGLLSHALKRYVLLSCSVIKIKHCIVHNKHVTKIMRYMRSFTYDKITKANPHVTVFKGKKEKEGSKTKITINIAI